MKKTINIFYDTGTKWGIKTNKSTRWLKKFNSKDQAVEYGTKLAKRKNNKLIIYRENGTKYSIDSFCKNPFPPKD